MLNFEGQKLIIEPDLDNDGQSAIKISLHLVEALGEAVNRGDAVEGAKLVDFGFEGDVLKLSIDTDKDGEKLMEIEVDLSEAFDELKSRL